MRQLAKNQAAVKTLCVVALSLSLTTASGTNGAWADSFYNWTFSGGGVFAGGTFQVNNSNIIVGITNGTVTGFPGSSSTITALVVPGVFPSNAPSDNIFNPTSPFLTYNGVSFRTDRRLNLFWDSGTAVYKLIDDLFLGNVVAGTFAAALSQ